MDILIAKSFGVGFGERVILAELDFELPAQKITVLAGPTGTGKSTLMRSIAGLNSANPRYKWWGTLSYLGNPVTEEHHPPMVQQHARLLQSTVLDALSENVRRQKASTPVETREAVLSYIQEMGFAELQTDFSRPTMELPVLYQRIVGILREAACSPGLLMIDEPTYGLSDYDSFVLLDLLRHIAQKTSILVSLHNQKQMQSVADDIILLAGGRIQEASRSAQFFSQPLTAAGQQFVRTGSCALPAPDAKPEDLAEDIAPPPALPTIAQLAIQAAPESQGPRGFTWVVPGKLAGTPMPGAVFDIRHDLEALRRVGVTCLITLTENDLPQEPLRQYGLTNLHLSIKDREPPTEAQVSMLLARMDALLKKGEVLAVHCLAGIGRTGTVLACWLIREGLTAQEALLRVRRIDPKFVQSTVQEEFLQLYENWILKRVFNPA